MLTGRRGALKIAADYHARTPGGTRCISVRSTPTTSRSSARDGAMDLYHGDLRAMDATGGKIFDDVDYQHYLEYIGEEVKTWSYMKFPFIQSLGPEDGWYRVGPLARLNTCDFIDTPEAEAARKDFMRSRGRQARQRDHGLPLGADDRARCTPSKTIRDLLHDPDLQGTDLVVTGQAPPRRRWASSKRRAARCSITTGSTRTTRSVVAT